jgi:aryl-phospho-beta-D-glucosidase BglC (GH1 family)
MECPTKEKFKMKKIIFFIPATLSVALILYSTGGNHMNINKSEFIRRDNDRLVVGKDDEEIFLRGINISSSKASKPDESVYKDVAGMNMNVVRLHLSYRFFYDAGPTNEYKESAWVWLNEHIKFAKKYEIFLILQLSNIEGAQFVPVKGVPYVYRIWEDKQCQNNFSSLWQEIAKRYKDERQIAGYGLFLEPVCSKSVDQWKRLADDTIIKIREVDMNHVIFIERAYGENETRREVSKIELPIDKAFFLVNDDNVVYEFYFFERDEFTHQFAPWRPEPEIQKRLAYPDNEYEIIYQEEKGLKKSFPFDKNYLDFYVQRQLEFGKEHKVPMSVWGFGALKTCFQNNRGGYTWLKDAVDLFNEHRLHWTFYVYENEQFGTIADEKIKKILRDALYD